jgi:hypothetical protein
VTRVLGERALNRAVLARELLLERSPLPVPRALDTADREVRNEATALVRFHESDAGSFAVRRTRIEGSSV